MRRLIGIEAGGTKFVCVLGDETGAVFDSLEILTETPDITLAAVRAFIRKHHLEAPIDAIGVGAFGPIDRDPASPQYGFITSTPKLAWRQCDVVGALHAEFRLPIGFDTDVNAAALGEFYWGHGRGCKHILYLTVGTGIGGGVILNSKVQHGVMHAELGHVLIPHDRVKDPFAGICPNHRDCLEGLASGPAIKARWQVNSALELAADHPAWDLEADYLAYAMANYILCFSPERIILGGYIQNSSVQHIEKTIVLAALGQEAGNIGALALAKEALKEALGKKIKL